MYKHKQQKLISQKDSQIPRDWSRHDSETYSVLMSVYAAEKPDNLLVSLNSMVNQTFPPDEIVLVEDGPLTTGLYKAISDFSTTHTDLLHIVSLPKNVGLGKALGIGVKECSNNIIARMDSDDYSYPDRIEKQLARMKSENLDMVGTQVCEFLATIENKISVSKLPITNTEIHRYSHSRNPFRHPSVLLKKEKVIEAGNYNGEYLYFEDWDLFNRMLSKGCRAENLSEILVAMRVSEDFYERRGGKQYLAHVLKIKCGQLKNGYFSISQFLISIIPHVFVCIMPNRMRAMIYTKLLRRKSK